MVLLPTEITKIGIMKNLNDMQGPCDIGFHVPLNTEWSNIINIWTSLGGGSSDGTNFGITLKLPCSGYRYMGDGSISNQGSYGRYWCSNYVSYGNSYIIRADSYNLGITSDAGGNGFSIRPFKDIPVIPDSSWTKLYGTSIEAGGIFHDTTLGLISLSSNGSTWVTISDKNCGASTVYNSGDTLSEANCGKYYQWGNNYGFAWTGSITTSSTAVDASSYGPGNYYSSSTFIKTTSAYYYTWDSSFNQNLRGGVTQQIGLQEVPIKTVSTFKTGTLYTNMQGPCDEGFHIPTKNDISSIYSKILGLGLTSNPGRQFAYYLKLPYAGERDSYSAVSGQGSGTFYWLCEGYSSNMYAYYLSFEYSNIYYNSYQTKKQGGTIRPFKDTPVIPNSSWTVLYQGTGTAGIYHNATLGLISISSDGSNWQTIANKNLGATQAYNDENTFNQANCGKYYQRGNNYGFNFTGNVSNTTSQVNASSYGPGNYYSSSNFYSGSSGNRDSSGNNNLWGFVSGTTQGLVEHIIYETTPPTPVYQPVEDVIVTSYYTTFNNTSYYMGICFTPKVNCTLDKIKFQYGNVNGTVKICQGDVLGSTTGQVTYTKGANTGQDFTLPTPYDMTAGVNYCVGIKGNYQAYYNGNPPTADLTNITYKRGSNSANTSHISAVYNISSLTTTQTS